MRTSPRGPVNLVVAPSFVSNVETYSDQPDRARWLERLASFAAPSLGK
jgi:hypothetical protein